MVYITIYVNIVEKIMQYIKYYISMYWNQLLQKKAAIIFKYVVIQ